MLNLAYKIELFNEVLNYIIWWKLKKKYYEAMRLCHSKFLFNVKRMRKIIHSPSLCIKFNKNSYILFLKVWYLKYRINIKSLNQFFISILSFWKKKQTTIGMFLDQCCPDWQWHEMPHDTNKKIYKMLIFFKCQQ